MEVKEIMKHVDHTLLKPYASWEEIRSLCREAIEYQAASVCVPPCYVRRISEAFGDQLRICTVIGFPLGYGCTEAKREEAVQAIKDGAHEIDMVINLTDVKNGNFSKVKEEIEGIRSVTEGKILKVIIETCYLTKEEKEALCRIVTEAGADYIKTSTGFGTAGAAMEDIQLMKEQTGPEVRIKAAGGIRTKEDMEAFLQAGCDRIGTSAAVSLIRGETHQAGY